jgi:hypothetical protein
VRAVVVSRVPVSLAKAALTLEGTRIRVSLTSTAQKFLAGGFGLTCSLVGVAVVEDVAVGVVKCVSAVVNMLHA